MSGFYLAALFYLTLGVVLVLLGIVILKENTRQRINRITGIMMFLAGAGPIFGAFGLLMQTVSGSQVDLEPFRKVFLIWEFFFPQLLLFSFVFPREFDWFKKHPRLSTVIFIPHMVHFLLVVAFSNPEQIYNFVNLQAITDQFGLIVQPLALFLGLVLSLLSLLYKFHLNFFAVVNLAYVVSAIALMEWGFRGMRSRRFKEQVAVVLWGIRISVGLYTVAFIFPHLHLIRTSPLFAHLLTSFALLVGAGSIAWAIIRYQFLDIRLIIRRGLVFSLAFAVLIGIYLFIYQQGKKIVTPLFELQIPVLEILFFIIALLLFQPILGTIERLIERVFMRDRRDYRNVLQDLSHNVLTIFDVEALRAKIKSTLQDVLSVVWAELLIADKDGSFSLNRPHSFLVFHRRDKWIGALMDEKKPVGFDEIQRRVDQDEGLEKLGALNPFLVIPLVYREHLVGILLLGDKETRLQFTAEEMMILTVLSSQTAIAIENARLHQEALTQKMIEEELSFARDIQKNLLPKESPSNRYFELAGINLPSREVGGDYYDFIDLDEKRVGIAIGDISGKGVPAALLMSNLQAAFRISAVRKQDTHHVIEQINRHITHTTTPDKFATFFYGVLDTEKMVFEYTNAGHNSPIWYRKQEGVVTLREGGLVMGIVDTAVYESSRIALGPEDALVFYTDGVTEALNTDDVEYGEERLFRVVGQCAECSSRQILDSILDSVIDFTHGYLQADDLTLVVLKVKSGDE